MSKKETISKNLRPLIENLMKDLGYTEEEAIAIVESEVELLRGMAPPREVMIKD